MFVPVTCQYCRRNLGAMNYNLGSYPRPCDCEAAKAAREAKAKAESTPEAKAAKAAEIAKYRRQAAESAVNAARMDVERAQARLLKATNALTLVAVAQAPQGHDTLRGPEGFDWDANARD